MSIKVLTNRSLDNEPSLLIEVANTRIAVGVPNNFLRATRMANLKVTQLTQILLLSTPSPEITGLHELYYTLKKCRGAGIQYDGPIDLYSYLDAHHFKHNQSTTSSIEYTKIELPHSIAYDVIIKPQYTHPNSQSIKEHNLTNSMVKKLKQDGSITTPNGLTINACDVFHVCPQRRILLIDLTSLEDLQNIPESSNFDVIFHFTNCSVLTQPQYFEYFTKTQFNICFCPSDSSQSYEAIDYFETFGMPYSLQSTPTINPPPGFISLTSFSSLDINDTISINPSPVRSIHPPKSLVLNEPINLTILGSGESNPTSLRNPTSHLIQIPQGFILLDAGSGTLGQMYRLFGMDRTAFILESLQVIWISHSHVDHVSGLAQILLERSKYSQSKVPLLAPLDIVGDVPSLPTSTFQLVDRAEEFHGEGFDLRSVPVFHENDPMACIIDFSDTTRIVYSGDRLPKGELESVVHECNLLIHEACLAFESKPSRVRHTTVPGALSASEQMGAQFTILTHLNFKPKIEDWARIPPNVIYSFDYLSVSLQSLQEQFEHIRSTKI